MLEFADQQPPSIRIIGIDISPRQFPADLPPNVELSIHSIAQLPAEWTGSFSFIHQRLLLGGLTPSTWPLAVAEMQRVLVPGGWVELLEVACEPLNLGVSPPSKKLDELVRRFHNSRGVVRNLDVYLPEVLHTAGFINTTVVERPIVTKRSPDNDTDPAMHMYDLWMGMKGPILEQGGLGMVSSEEEFDEMMAGALEEWIRSEDASLRYFTVYAQKTSA